LQVHLRARADHSADAIVGPVDVDGERLVVAANVVAVVLADVDGRARQLVAFELERHAGARRGKYHLIGGGAGDDVLLNLTRWLLLHEQKGQEPHHTPPSSVRRLDHRDRKHPSRYSSGFSESARGLAFAKAGQADRVPSILYLYNVRIVANGHARL